MRSMARALVAALCLAGCHGSVRTPASAGDDARERPTPGAPAAPIARAPSAPSSDEAPGLPADPAPPESPRGDPAERGTIAKDSFPFADEDPENRCRPASHPLAERLTRDLRTPVLAFACDSLLLDEDPADVPTQMRVPGFVVRRASHSLGGENEVRAESGGAWRFVKRYGGELGLQNDAREALRGNEKGGFVQRVASTRIEAEGFVDVAVYGERFVEARFSVMPGLSQYVGLRATWNDARAKVLAHAASSGLVSPRVIAMPRGIVRRADGLVWVVDVVGIQMDAAGISATAPRRFVVNASTHAILSETTLRQRGGLVHDP